MDAFEHIVGELFWARGYWVRTSVTVALTKAQKAELGNPSMPRPEIDVVAYDGRNNRLLAIECKSYLNSRGVTYAELSGDKPGDRYKLFCRPLLRERVLSELAAQSVERGLCAPSVAVTLALAAGRIYRDDQLKIAALFAEHGWEFFGPDWITARLREQAATDYSNQVATVAAKLLLNIKPGAGVSATG